MLKRWLQCTKDDVIAMANRRYMKRAGNKLLLLLAAAIVWGFGGAMFIGDTNPALKWGLIGLVVFVVIFLTVAWDKGQKYERKKLLEEWRDETVSPDKQ